jgi:hypothetical protein
VLADTENKKCALGKECIMPAWDGICRKSLIGNRHGRGNAQRRIKRWKNVLKVDLDEVKCEALYRTDLIQTEIS